jgi:hypothetical protein
LKLHLLIENPGPVWFWFDLGPVRSEYQVGLPMIRGDYLICHELWPMHSSGQSQPAFADHDPQLRA